MTGRTLKQVSDAQQLGGMGQIDPALLSRNASQAEFQVGPYSQVREQAGFLKYVTQCAFMDRDKQVVLAVLPDLIIDLHKCLAGTLQPGDAAQASGFPRAGMSKQRGHAFTG